MIKVKRYKRIILLNHNAQNMILFSDDEEYKKFTVIARLKRMKHKVRLVGKRRSGYYY